METLPKLIRLGETQRRVRTFGKAELVNTLSDGRTIDYRVVSPEYLEVLLKKSSFNLSRMRAFDFKLPRAEGKRWPEPPRLNGNIDFFDPVSNELLCTGTVYMMNIKKKRSTGIIYVMNFEWVHEIITDFTVPETVS